MNRPRFRSNALFGLLFALVAIWVVWVAAKTGDGPWFHSDAGGLGQDKFVPASFELQQEGVNLEGGVEWINVAGPIKIEELRGKVVLLDFWTYCCINCHHVIPDLEYLEKKYPNELVVIGVHTPKFTAEADSENIRRKVAEYRIKHPVINDANQVLWTKFGVTSWPTLIVIDPTGKFVGAAPGEGNRQVLDREIAKLVREGKAKGTLNETPVTFFPESEKPSNSPLLYPGKVAADAESNRLFVSDTGHNRIVMSDLEGKNAQTIGDGQQGFLDGAFEKARFNRPQGLCLVGETLYIADTENHAIRAVDLKEKTVATVAGTGVQGYKRTGRGPAKSTALSSPWDVLLLPGTKLLAIAIAGQHQLWTLDLETNIVGVFAGTSRENITDGSALEANFAQPSGLATDGTYLYVADSEVSAIRRVAFKKRPVMVSSIVGVGLFGFGDVDGQGAEVRLQHCLGVTFGGGKLYIADTYNNKIKVCEPDKKTVNSFLGSREHGDSDDPPKFYQPGGVSFAADKLYIADTNNGKIKVVDLKTKQATTLAFEGLTPPKPTKRAFKFVNATTQEATAVKVAPGKTLTFDVTIEPPSGFKFNKADAFRYLAEAVEPADALADDPSAAAGRIDPPSGDFSISIPLAKDFQDGDKLNIKVGVSAVVCKDGATGLCIPKGYIWNVPVVFSKDAGESAKLVGRAGKKK